MSQKVDFLIVGGGISGHLIQLELETRGKSTLLIDHGQNHSTAVAAGIVNPVTGKYMSLTWRADEFFPFLKDYYLRLGKKYDVGLYTEKPILRILNSAGEQNIWLEKSAKPVYAKYCSFEKGNIKGIVNPYGHLKIKYGGDVKIEALIKHLKHDFTRVEEVFMYDQLNLHQKKYKDINFDDIIFCEGYQMKDNPHFSFLNLIPNKGEMLVIECHGLDESFIYSGSSFIQPLGNARFRVGATYDRETTSLELTEKQKERLISNCKKVLNLPFQVVDHICGIRPTTIDRRPLLGSHPEQSFVHLFNGLGSKGYSMVPLLAKEMTDFLLNSTPLHSETDLRRFC